MGNFSENAYLGIDPGSKGAICISVPENDYIEFITMDSSHWRIFQLLAAWDNRFNIKVIMIENVHAIQGTSAGSNFKFGYNTGAVNALASATGNHVDKVNPKKWQKFIGVVKKGKAVKKEVCEISERLYPKAGVRGPRGGILDGLSDSLMIAHYAYHQYKSK